MTNKKHKKETKAMKKKSNLPTLFEISSEYREALTELVDLEDEAVVDTLDALKGTLELKAGNISFFVKNLEITSDGMKKAEENIASRRRTLDKKIDRIKSYIKTNMINAGIKKIELPEFVITVKDNPPKVDVVNEDIIPEKYFCAKTYLSPDKKLIKKDLADGEDVDGCTLTQNTRLEIK